MWRARTVAVSALMVVMAAGCGDGDPGGSLTADADDDRAADTAASAEPADDAGPVGGGADAGTLPDDWPAQFPDPPAGAVMDGIRGPIEDRDRDLYVVDYLVEDQDLQDLFAYYLRELPAAGWEGLYDADPATVTVTAATNFRGFGASGEVMLNNSQGPVLIRVFMYLDR